MSLIVFFSTDAGIVVVGDRASTRAKAALGDAVDLAVGEVSGASKVFAFDNHTVFGVTGIPTMAYAMQDGSRQIAFSAANLIMQFGRRTPYSSDGVEFWTELRQLLLNELRTKAPPGPFWKPPEDGFVFQAMFAHVPRDGGFWSYRCLRLHAHPEGAGFKLLFEVVPHPMPSLRVIGNDRVFIELASGDDSRFDDVRAEPVMRRVFSPAIEKPCSWQEAAAFAKRLCAATNERRLLLEAEDTGHNVSVATDGWLLSETGWQRLWKNE